MNSVLNITVNMYFFIYDLYFLNSVFEHDVLHIVIEKKSGKNSVISYLYNKHILLKTVISSPFSPLLSYYFFEVSSI